MKLIPVLFTSIAALFVFLSAFAHPGVFYGEDAKRTPYMAKLTVRGQDAAGVCGGVLIHPEWVLSAAHCLNPKYIGEFIEIQVHVGEYDISRPDGEYTIQATEVYTFGYQWDDPPTAPDDLVLIHLAETLTRTASMTETIIDFILLSHDQPMTGTVLHFFGWGAQDGDTHNPILQVGVMTIDAVDGFIHAVGEQYSGGGDSGGPAVISGTMTLAGILVNGRDEYTGFVNVADFAEEIEAVIAAQTRPPVWRVYLPVVHR